MNDKSNITYDGLENSKNENSDAIEDGKNRERKKYSRFQKAAALFTVIVLSVLILATLIAAISCANAEVILALLFCDIAIPIFIYAFLLITKHLKN